jgi:hypothetical protein
VDGELAVLPAPHPRRLLQRLLGELDADLLVLKQLLERVTELGGVVKQARPRVRLAREAFQNPLRDPRALPRHQTHMRDGRRAGEVRQVGRDQRDRTALQHAAENHHLAARVLDRRRASLRPLVRAHLQTVQLEPTTNLGEVDAPGFADSGSGGPATNLGEVDAPGFADSGSGGPATNLGEVDAPGFADSGSGD